MSDIQDKTKQMESNMFLNNLVKLVPVEIVALWAIISGLIPITATALSVWVIFGLLAILVPFYVIFTLKVKKIDQIILMSVAFPIWVLAMGGLPIIGLFAIEPWMMSVVLALFTLVPPMFYGKSITSEVEVSKEVVEGVTNSTNIKKPASWRQVDA